MELKIHEERLTHRAAHLSWERAPGGGSSLDLQLVAARSPGPEAWRDVLSPRLPRGMNLPRTSKGAFPSPSTRLFSFFFSFSLSAIATPPGGVAGISLAYLAGAHRYRGDICVRGVALSTRREDSGTTMMLLRAALIPRPAIRELWSICFPRFVSWRACL